MTPSRTTRVPVLVSGGGPSGLAAAVELGRRGIEVVVVEPRTTLDPLRARAKTTSVRTMEHLRRWGLADRLRAASPIPVGHAQDVVFCTGLLGHEITRFPEAFGLTVGRREEYAEAGQQDKAGQGDHRSGHHKARAACRRRFGAAREVECGAVVPAFVKQSRPSLAKKIPRP